MSEEERLALLTPDTRERVEATLKKLREEGHDVRATSTLRTCAEQYKINATGRSPAIGCRSWHVWGRAADCFFFENGKIVPDGTDPRYLRLGEVAKSFGMIWGGDFGSNAVAERHHIEYHPGMNIKDLCPDPKQCETAVSGKPPEPDKPGLPEPVKESEGQDWPEEGFSGWTVVLTAGVTAVATALIVQGLSKGK